MESWIFLHIPIEDWQERWISNYERIFDAWQAGGIAGLGFGRLLFADDNGGFTVPAYRSDPEIFRRRGIELAATDAPLNADKENWPMTDLRVDWCEDDPIAALHALWKYWEPQMNDYVARALRPLVRTVLRCAR